MNGLRAETQTTADQRPSAWQHQKTYSGVCYQLVWGLSQNLSSPLLNLFHQQVDYTRHLHALQRCVSSRHWKKTIIVGGVVQRNALLLTPVDAGDLTACEHVIQRRDRIGPRHAESCVVQPGGTGLISWKGKGRGKSWNAGDDSHLPSPIIFGDRGSVPRCSPHTHALSTEGKVFSAPYKKHFCLLSVFRKTQGVGDMVKQTQNTHSIQVHVQQHWLR